MLWEEAVDGKNELVVDVEKVIERIEVAAWLRLDEIEASRRAWAIRIVLLE